MKRLIILAFLGIAVASCGQNEGLTNEKGEPVTSTGEVKRVERVDEVTFLAFIQNNNDVQLVDVRTPGEFTNGNIPGAVNIDYSNASFKSEIEKLDKTKPIAIYCQSGGRSGKALKMMKAMDFITVLELEGGYGNYVTPGN